MSSLGEDVLKRLEEDTVKTVDRLVSFLLQNRMHSSPIFTRAVIESLYALIACSQITEPEESLTNIKNIIHNNCLVLDEDVRIERTSQGCLNYGRLSAMVNDSMRVIFLCGNLIMGSDTAQLWQSMREYPRVLAKRRTKLDKQPWLWDLCSYLAMLLAYRSWKGTEYDEHILWATKEIASELLANSNLPANLAGYMLLLSKNAEETGLPKTGLQYVEIYNSLEWGREYRDLSFKIFDGLTIGISQEAFAQDILELLDLHERNPNPREGDLAAFLQVSAMLLLVNGRKIAVPFFTYQYPEPSFFGIVIATYLTIVDSLETQRKTTTKLEENDYRYDFLEGLQVRFGNLATAETFRCKGFSDIQVTNPVNANEALVTEIKIWRGLKYYQEGIDQAIGYLRDKEDLVVMIAIKDKETSSSIDFVKSLCDSITTHEGYVVSTISRGVIKKAIHSLADDAYIYSEHYKDEGRSRKVKVYHVFVRI